MKYYLTCEHCGHHNEVNNEFLTFCGQCKKKLSNNFRDWSKHHPEADFDAFKAESCTPESALTAASEEHAAKKDELSHWVGISVTLAVILGLGIFALPTVLKMSSLSGVIKEEIRQSIPPEFMWKNYELGQYGLSLESPFAIEKASVPIADQLGEFVQNSEAYSALSSANDFYCGISVVEYTPTIGQANIEAAMSMSAEAIRNKGGISNFTYRQDEFNISGIDGLRQDGSYMEKGLSVQFINLGLTQGLVTWQVFLGFNKDIPGMSATAEKMIESLKIEYNSIN